MYKQSFSCKTNCTEVKQTADRPGVVVCFKRETPSPTLYPRRYGCLRFIATMMMMTVMMVLLRDGKNLGFLRNSFKFKKKFFLGF